MHAKFSSGQIANVVKPAIDYFKRRQFAYEQAILNVALVKSENEMKPYWVTIELLPKNYEEKAEYPIKYDYGDLMLCSYLISPDKILNFLISAINNQAIELTDGIILKIGSNAESSIWYSNSAYGYLHQKWPCNYVIFNFEIPRLTDEIVLAKRDLPFYPDMYTAITNFLKLSYKLSPNMTSGQMIIPISDFRSRIGEVIISDKKVTMTVENKEISHDKLIGKIYMTKGDFRSSQSGNLVFDESKKASFEGDFDPEIVYLCILDNDDNIVDARDINLLWTRYDPDTKIETPRLQVEEFLKRGETENVEFKVKPSDEFLETVVSFANTSGGVILLGVDDNARVIGYDENMDRMRDRITNTISSNVIPPTIKFDLERIELDSGNIEDDKRKAIILVRIFVGENKPYYLRDKGILVRRGGTDRWITPNELEQIYASKFRTGNPSGHSSVLY